MDIQPNILRMGRCHICNKCDCLVVNIEHSCYKCWNCCNCDDSYGNCLYNTTLLRTCVDCLTKINLNSEEILIKDQTCFICKKNDYEEYNGCSFCVFSRCYNCNIKLCGYCKEIRCKEIGFKCDYQKKKEEKQYKYKNKNK